MDAIARGLAAAGKAQAQQAKAIAAPNRYVALLGDSRSAQSTYTDANNNAFAASGYINWIRYLTGQRVTFRQSDNFGVFGDNTAQVLARTDAALASSNAGLFVVFCGTNDRNDLMTLAWTVANLTAIRDKVLAAGRRLLFIAELPRDGVTYGLSGTQLNYHLGTRQWLIDQRDEVAGVYVADPWPLYVDPTAANAPGKTGLNNDGIHPTSAGARAIALSMQNIIQTIYPPVSILPATNSDAYSGTGNPRGSLIVNPMVTGTSGTQATGSSLGGGTSTGSIASSWTNQFTNVTGLTFTYSKVTINGDEWQQIDITGTAPASGTSQALMMRQVIQAAAIGAGVEIEAAAAIQWSNVSGFTQLSLRMKDPTSNFGWTDMLGGAGQVPAAGAGVMLTPPATLLTNDMRLELDGEFVNGATVTGTIQVRAITARRTQG